MVRRGSSARFVIGALVLAALGLTAPWGPSTALATTNQTKTLSLSIPGPFNGCTFLDAGATPSTDAINDLLLPSAFLTSSAGNLYGANGPITSAELTSLTPETVKYTIAPHSGGATAMPSPGTTSSDGGSARRTSRASRAMATATSRR